MLTVNSAPAEDRVRSLAYALWLEEGRPDGRAEAHWFKAMELVNAEALATSPGQPRKTKTQAKPRKRS